MCSLVALTPTACGESEQAKAEKSVCEAKTQIANGVQSLQQLTPQTVTVATVQSDINAIDEGLQKMKEAQSQLSGRRKEEISKASQTLSSDLSALASELKNLTPAAAKSQLTGALEKLSTSFKQALAPISC